MPNVVSLPFPPAYRHVEVAEHVSAPQSSMKILHLSTYDIAGGAGRAAYRLHTGLRQAGLLSSMFVREARTKDDSVITFEPTQKFWGRVGRRFRREEIRWNLSPSAGAENTQFEPFRSDRSEYGGDVVSKLPMCDVINVHWIADFVDYASFFGAIPKGK